MAETENRSDKPISISLHPKHWVVMVAAVDLLNQSAMNRIADLKRQGVDQSTLSATTVTALAAPTIVRGILIKELAAQGVMTPQTNAALGIDALMDAIEKHRREE
jgi:hypothetical protein